jgi:hypothetical protein
LPTSRAGEVLPAGLSGAGIPAAAHASLKRAVIGAISAAVGRALKSPTSTFDPAGAVSTTAAMTAVCSSLSTAVVCRCVL